MPLSAEHAMDGVNEEEAICGGLITKVIRKKGRTHGGRIKGGPSQYPERLLRSPFSGSPGFNKYL
jgi:hypothetical protein